MIVNLLCVLPQLTIVPVNDVPILSLISGVSHELYSYTEDDPAINIGRNITLGDVDSSILFVSLNLTSEYVHCVCFGRLDTIYMHT